MNPEGVGRLPKRTTGRVCLCCRYHGDLFNLSGGKRRKEFISYRFPMKTIDLTKYKSLWKTKKALDTVNAEDWEDILRYYGPKTGKPIGKITWRALADRVFSEYCRLFYADNKGYVTCITSGVRMFWKDAQCGHFISRGVLKYRYDIQNCYPQSYAENVLLSGNYKAYTLRMIDILGKEKVEEMINDKELRTLSQSWYEENIMERYKFIVEKKKIIEENS